MSLYAVSSDVSDRGSEVAASANRRRGARYTSITVWVLLGTAAGTVAQAGSAAVPSAAASERCGVPGYSYAGLQDARRTHGVRATVIALAKPIVAEGHVAAWVGVGGPGEGPGGTDSWIQIGLSAFADGSSRLYFEVNRHGAGPQYTQLAARVETGRPHEVAALEIASRPDWWRVWLDGAPVSPPVNLPKSSGRWRPIVTAETWDGGKAVCNRFAYRFESIAIAARRGGSWIPFVVGAVFRDPGYRVVREPGPTFVADAIGTPR